MYDEIAKEIGKDKTTLRHYKQISESVESVRRQPLLSFSHHVEVTSLTHEKQKEFLNRMVG